MNKKTLIAGGILAIVALLGGNEIKDQVERTAAVAEFKQPVSVEYQKRKVGEEIKSLRTPNSVTYKSDGGKYNAHIFAGQKYFLDTDADTLAFIDLTVHEISALAKLNPLRTHDKFVDAGVYQATWFDGKPHDYTFYKGDYSVSYTALFSAAGVTTVTERNNSGVKQTHTVTNTGVSELRWLMDTEAAVSVEGSAVVFSDSSGTEQFQIPPPVAWDKDKIPVAVAVSVSGDTLIYAFTVAAGQYPVTVDPTTTTAYAAGTGTGRVNYSVTPSSFAAARDSVAGTSYTAGQGLVGTYQSAPRYDNFRGTYVFDTSAIPDGAVIDSAKVTVYVQQDVYAAAAGLYFVQATLTGAPATSWYNDFTGWVSGANPYSGYVSLGDTLLPSITTTDSVTSYFNATGRGVVNVTGNTTFMLVTGADLRNVDQGANAYFYFGTAPYMHIQYTYTDPPNAPTNFAVTVPADDDSTTYLYVTVTPNHSASVDSFTVVSSGTGTWRGKFATTTSTSMILTGLSPGAKYTMVARVDSGGAYSESNIAYNYTWADTFTVSQAFNDGSLYVLDTGYYGTARSATTAYDLSPLNNIQVGQYANYTVSRGFLQFLLPEPMASVSVATLHLYGYADESTTDFQVKLYGAPVYPPELTVADYINFNGWQADSTAFTGATWNNPWNSQSYSATWSNIVLSGAGRNGMVSISKSDTTSFAIAMISLEDSMYSKPTTQEMLSFYTSAESGKEPYISFTYTPARPTSVALDPISATSIIITWTDNTSDETGFRIIDHIASAYLDSADADSTYKVMTGLDVNTLYRYRVQVKGGVADGVRSFADSAYTYPNVPGTPTVSSPAGVQDSIKVVVAVNSNPAYTLFLPFVTTVAGDTLVFNRHRRILQTITPFFVNSDSLNSTIASNDSVWATYANWGSATGITVGGADIGKTYTAKVLAKSGQ